MSVFYTEPYTYNIEPMYEERPSIDKVSTSGRNGSLLKELGLKTNWEYRQYITKNGDEILYYNRSQGYKDNGVSTVSGPLPVSRGVSTSDLKEAYLNQYRMESMMVAPELSTEDVFNIRNKK